MLCAQLGFSILILSSCEITEETQRQHWHTGHWPLCDIVRMLPLTGTRRKLGRWAEQIAALCRVSAGLSGC